MYAKRIIPCLDVKNGRVVKGMSFVNLVDAGDPCGNVQSNTIKKAQTSLYFSTLQLQAIQEILPLIW